MALKASSMSDIPLARVDSKTSSKYTPSYQTQYTENSSLAKFETASEDSSTISPFLTTSNFTPTSALQIQALGKTPISLPTPAKQLEIPIFSIATGRPAYLSIRAKRCKGNCILVNAEDETQTTIAQTTYSFGPGRSPQVRIGADDDLGADCFKVIGKGLTTRAIFFKSRKWGKFEWRYARKHERVLVGENVNNLLVLEKIIELEGDKEERIRVAQLVRSDETRTPGTKAIYAGNGGRLEICFEAEGGKGQWIDEVTVVTTCLIMLKKEIDRLRAVQIMIMTGVASGGS